MFSICGICGYVLLSIFFSLRNLGLFNFLNFSNLNFFSPEFYRSNRNKFLNISFIRSDKILTFTVYVIYFIFAIFGIFEVFNMSNKISNFMGNYNRCNLNLINEENCEFSYYMLFGLKNSFNFSMGMILIQIFEGISVFLLICFAIILPIKSTSAFFIGNGITNDNIYNDIENDNKSEYQKCPQKEKLNVEY